jgi:RHS repeat-associated protein
VNTPRDARGNITGVSATVNGVSTPLLSNMTYRADGLLTSQTVGNGLGDRRLYNVAGRLTTQPLGAADTRVYDYDNNGNLTRKQTLPEVATYGYDVLNQLTNDNDPTPEALTYATNGNRKTRAGQSYLYLANSNRLTRVAGASVVDDNAGNIKTHPLTGHTYTYTDAGQLNLVYQGSALAAVYLYTPQGLRTLKFDGTAITLYHYDDAGHLLQETTNTGTLIRAYVWADDLPVAQITNTPTGETLVYLHTDPLHTPRLATDPTGKVVWRWEGNAFGDTPPNEDVDGNGIRTTVNLRFAGQYYDKETGLHYNWHRYYDPRLGRYITSDPIGLEGGLNTYTYVYNNPLRFVDPMGLFCLGSGCHDSPLHQPPVNPPNTGAGSGSGGGNVIPFPGNPSRPGTQFFPGPGSGNSSNDECTFTGKALVSRRTSGYGYTVSCQMKCPKGCDAPGIRYFIIDWPMRVDNSSPSTFTLMCPASVPSSWTDSRPFR